MDNNFENNFFQINLSQQGANWLLRVCKITTWLFALGCCCSVLSGISIGIRYFKLYNAGGFDDSLSGRFRLIAVVFEVLFTIVTFVQLIYFYKFARQCRRGIELQQADLFNESFQSLLRNSLVTAVMFILNLAFTCLVMYWQLFMTN
jgi:hypothetical protein